MYTQKSFESFVGKLPGVTFHDQWESDVAKVGGKVFALLNFRDGKPSAITFKVEELTFEMLSGMDGIGQASHFAKRKWVTVQKGTALSVKDLKAYIETSHKLVAAGLTKKLRAELGIPTD